MDDLDEAIDLQHEIKANLRTYVEFEHATRLMASVGELVKAAKKYAAIEPLLRELIEARSEATQGQWGKHKQAQGSIACGRRPIATTSGYSDNFHQKAIDEENNNNNQFIITAANIANKIKEIMKDK